MAPGLGQSQPLGDESSVPLVLSDDSVSAAALRSSGGSMLRTSADSSQPSRPGTAPAAAAAGPGQMNPKDLRALGFSSSAVDALQRLSGRNPKLLQALLHMERGSDGRVSERTIQNVRVALDEARKEASMSRSLAHSSLNSSTRTDPGTVARPTAPDNGTGMDPPGPSTAEPERDPESLVLRQSGLLPVFIPGEDKPIAPAAVQTGPAVVEPGDRSPVGTSSVSTSTVSVSTTTAAAAASADPAPVLPPLQSRPSTLPPLQRSPAEPPAAVSAAAQVSSDLAAPVDLRASLDSTGASPALPLPGSARNSAEVATVAPAPAAAAVAQDVRASTGALRDSAVASLPPSGRADVRSSQINPAASDSVAIPTAGDGAQDGQQGLSSADVGFRSMAATSTSQELKVLMDGSRDVDRCVGARVPTAPRPNSRWFDPGSPAVA